MKWSNAKKELLKDEETKAAYESTTIEEVLRKKMQFYHRSCPADAVVAGYEDLEKCTCGIEAQIQDSIATIEQLVLEAIPKDEDLPTGHPQYEAGFGRDTARAEIRARLEEIFK